MAASAPRAIRARARSRMRNGGTTRRTGLLESNIQQEPDTASDDSDFSQSELMPNINSSGIACGLWEPVTKGTKLEDAIVTPKATYIAADGYGKNVWELKLISECRRLTGKAILALVILALYFLIVAGRFLVLICRDCGFASSQPSPI